MTSRERIFKALNHEESDRIPRDLGGTESSGLTALSMRNLHTHFGQNDELKIFEPYQYVAYVDDNLRQRFKIDTINLTPGPAVWVNARHPLGFDVLLPREWHEKEENDSSTIVLGSDGGIIARRPVGGCYFDPVNPPLSDVTEATELARFKKVFQNFDWPAFADETDSDLVRRADAMHASGDCVVFNLCCHILAAGQLLRGYENFMVDLLINEVLTQTLLDYLLESYIRRIDRLAPILRGKVDIVLMNDDLGTQAGPMLAPETYRSLIKPRQAQLFAHVKRSFGTPLLFHSCGAIREFIPDLIEIGVNALNPVQISAAGMDPSGLKRDFGDSITFWGGGIDTQSVLNKKTPDKILDAVRRNVDIMAEGGGFIFCQVHNIQPDVPPENIVAMFDALGS